MSEEEHHREREMAAHVEKVREQLILSDRTRVNTGLFTAISICCTIIGATWIASWQVQKYLGRIDAGQARIEAALNYKWSQAQMTSWSAALDRANRGLPGGGLSVPDPALFRAKSVPGENEP
jgi:hypothetical protein